MHRSNTYKINHINNYFLSFVLHYNLWRSNRISCYSELRFRSSNRDVWGVFKNLWRGAHLFRETSWLSIKWRLRLFWVRGRVKVMYLGCLGYSIGYSSWIIFWKYWSSMPDIIWNQTINKRFVLIAKPLRGFACKMDAYLFRNINVGIKKLRCLDVF